MEWFAILIPAVAGLVLKYYFHKKVVWWEVLLPMLPTIIVIPIVLCTASFSMTNDYERHGGWVVEARYYEDWNEYIHKICTRTEGSGKNARTIIYDCSYVQYHSAYYEVFDSNGYTVNVDSTTFEYFVNRFGNKSFTELHRHYYTDDGDLYTTRWAGNEAALQPMFTEHYYTNKVQASHGVLELPKVNDPKDLYEFPPLKNNFNDPAILGKHSQLGLADARLQRYNATLGKSKEVRFWILLFENKPRSIGLEQESYWSGGNKNEVVVCIGTKGNKVEWCYPFCFSPDGNTSNDTMKIEIRDFVEGKELDLVKTVDFIATDAVKNFKRKDFSEFDYLSIDTPAWAYWVIYILTIIATIGCCYWALLNEFEE